MMLDVTFSLVDCWIIFFQPFQGYLCYILVLTFPCWPCFCVTLATWRDAPGGVDEDQICSCGVVYARWWAEQMTMNCISPNEAQISIYIIYMMLLSATNLCLCQHQLVVYGPILEQVQCKCCWALLVVWCWWWCGAAICCVIDTSLTNNVSTAGQSTSSRRGEPDCTWTQGLCIYSILSP